MSDIFPDGMTMTLPTLKEFMKPYRKEWNEHPENHKYQSKEAYEYELESYYYETIGRGFMKAFGKEASARKDTR